jgi:hypothetical protein
MAEKLIEAVCRLYPEGPPDWSLPDLSDAKVRRALLSVVRPAGVTTLPRQFDAQHQE